MKLNCIIVDDEPSGRKILEEYISETDFLELVGKAENPLKALGLLEKERVDLIFLDVQMPKMNGIDFLRTLNNPPMVILTTAFPEFALQGFDLDVIDYLLKPLSLERFIKGVNKAKDFFHLHTHKLTRPDFFFVKCANKYEKVLYDELLFVEAANNYVLLQTIDKRLITYLTFKGIEETLVSQQFIKVHKSFIVSLSKIDSLDGEGLWIGKHQIPLSRGLKEEVMERVVNRNLLKR